MVHFSEIEDLGSLVEYVQDEDEFMDLIKESDMNDLYEQLGGGLPFSSQFITRWKSDLVRDSKFILFGPQKDRDGLAIPPNVHRPGSAEPTTAKTVTFGENPVERVNGARFQRSDPSTASPMQPQADPQRPIRKRKSYTSEISQRFRSSQIDTSPAAVNEVEMGRHHTPMTPREVEPDSGYAHVPSQKPQDSSPHGSKRIPLHESRYYDSSALPIQEAVMSGMSKQSIEADYQELKTIIPSPNECKISARHFGTHHRYKNIESFHPNPDETLVSLKSN